MDFTLSELLNLKQCVTVYRLDCDRRLRKVKRNKPLINDRYNEVPEQLRKEIGLESAEQQIDNFVTMKKEAVILSKKLDIAIKEVKHD